MQELQYSIPNHTKINVFEIWMRYRYELYSPQGELLADCRAVTAAEVDDIWVDEAFAQTASANTPLRNHGAFPVWHPRRGPNAMGGQFIAAAAREAGMQNRPVRETLRGLMDWWGTLPDERTSNLQAGVIPEYEAELIARWKEQQV